MRSETGCRDDQPADVYAVALAEAEALAKPVERRYCHTDVYGRGMVGRTSCEPVPLGQSFLALFLRPARLSIRSEPYP